MGITEDLQKVIQSKLVIRYRGSEAAYEQAVPCSICGKNHFAKSPLCLFVRNEGPVCESCGERFAPELMRTIEEYKDKDVRKLLAESSTKVTLTRDEWAEVRENVTALLKLSVDISKGLSRGIIEAPNGHIGLVHFAKELKKPEQKDGESDRDYELRVKTYRITKLFEILKKETYDRIELLQHYLVKLGMPQD